MAKEKTEADFQAESDAHTIGEAEAIKSDASRLKNAQRVTSKLASEAEAKARGMRKASKLKPSKTRTNSGKRTSGSKTS